MVKRRAFRLDCDTVYGRLQRRHRSVHTSRPASLRTRPGARRDDDLDRHGRTCASPPSVQAPSTRQWRCRHPICCSNKRVSICSCRWPMLPSCRPTGFTTTDKMLRDKREQVKRLLRALARGLAFSKERPKETIEIMAREWEIDRAVAEEVYDPVSRALSADGIASAAGLKEHFQIIPKTRHRHRRDSFGKSCRFSTFDRSAARVGNEIGTAVCLLRLGVFSE